MILFMSVRVGIDEFLHIGRYEADLREDLAGGRCPGEWLRCCVPGVDVVADLLDQDVDAGERAAADGLPGQDSEPDLDLVQPRGADGCEMEVDVRVLDQPLLDLWGGVRREVVQDHVYVLPGVRFHRLLEEGQEVLAVPGRPALADHFTGGHVQGGEQVRGAVPDVVGGALFARHEGDGQYRLGPVQGLDLRPLVDREDHRTAGWGEVEADHVGDLLRETQGPSRS